MTALPLMTALPPTFHDGPFPARIALVGEAPGVNEVAWGKPFVGASGKELDKMLAIAGLSRDSCFVINVFPEQPPSNKVDYFFRSKRDGWTGWPPLSKRWLAPEYAPFLAAFHAKLIACAPELVIALGGTAFWACTGLSGITANRGTFREATLGTAPDPTHTFTLLPTFHPAAILRVYENREIMILDLKKAADWLEDSPTLPEFSHEIEINPDVDSFEEWDEEIAAAPVLGVDVETKAGQIRTIALATSPSRAFVIPFWDDHGDYWATPEEEAWALHWVKKWLQGPASKVFHNGLYDLTYIWTTWGFAPHNCTDDTMILHHAEQPEMQKGLGFLGSIYTNHSAWKAAYRARSGKKDDEE